MKPSATPWVRSLLPSHKPCDNRTLVQVVATTTSMLLSIACSGKVGADDSLAGPSAHSDDTSADARESNDASTESSSSSAANTNRPNPSASADDSSTAPDDDSATPVDPTAPVASPPKVGLTLMRRLSNREYNNTIADLLGTELTPARDFLKETAHGFDNIANTLGMTAAQYNAYFDAAAHVARDVFSNPALRAPFDACDDGQPTCLATMIGD